MATTTRVLTASVNGTVYTTNANGALEAIDTCHSGATAPTNEVANGKLWLDTTTTPGILKMYNNAAWEEIGGSTSSPTFAGLTTTGNVSFGDSDEIVMGASSDFRIFHNGSNSYIQDNGTGSLIIQGSTGVFIQGRDATDMIRANEGSSVQLYHSDSVKVATTSTGVDVTGGLTATGTVTSGDVSINTTVPEDLLDIGRLGGNWSGPTTGTTSVALFHSGTTSTGSGAAITLGGGTAAPCEIYFADLDDADVGKIRYDHADNSMAFHTNNSERMVIDSAGNLTATGSVTAGDVTLSKTTPLIGTSGTTGYLTISGDTAGALGANLRLYGSAHATLADDILFRNDTTTVLQYNASVPEWNFVGNNIKTSGTVETTGGIYLGGTAAANLMDDYEEGTWTPVMRDDPSAGNLATVTTMSGTYTKVGNMVTVWFQAENIDTTGMTAANVVYVTGLPFAAIAKTSTFHNVGSVEATRIDFTNYLVSTVDDGGSSIIFRDIRDSLGILSMKSQDITTTAADLYTTITYETA